MIKYIIETPQGYVEEINYSDFTYTDNTEDAYKFDTDDEAWDVVDEYFTDDYDEQEAMGLYVNKLDYGNMDTTLSNSETDTLLDMIGSKLQAAEGLDNNKMVSGLLSLANSLLGKINKKG